MTDPDDRDQQHLRDTPLTLLINRRCGHIAGITNHTDPRLTTHLEHLRTQLHAAGRRGWRIEQRPATDTELEHLIRGTRCARCRLD